MGKKIDPLKAEAPTLLDGTPVDKEEAQKVHQRLLSGEMKIELAPGVAEELAKMGLTVEDIRAQMIAATKKTMS